MYFFAKKLFSMYDDFRNIIILVTNFLKWLNTHLLVIT